MPIKFPKQLKRPPWLTRSNVLWGTGIALVLGVAIALATGTLKAGIGAGTTTFTSEKTDSQGKVIESTKTTTPQDAKTLWDWLSLAGIPLSLAGLGFWLQLQQQKQTKALATIEQDIAKQSRQEEALQNYYDKVSALLVEKNLLAIPAKKDDATDEEKQLLDVSVDVIRARTLTTLRRLDKTRKTSLIQFLLESEVISKLKLSLAKADLSGADLTRANLEDANLEGANLNHTKLNGANLKGAKLKVADLSGASLYQAKLSGADLWQACFSATELNDTFLKGAKLTNLDGANLIYIDLTGVDLSGVSLNRTLLLGADLFDAEGLTKEQLEGQDPPYLCNTQLPEEIDIDPNRDCGKLHDEWFSERGYT